MTTKLACAFCMTMFICAVLGWGQFVFVHWNIALAIFAIVLAVIQGVGFVINLNQEEVEDGEE